MDYKTASDLNIDYEELEREGFTTLTNLVSKKLLLDFEKEIDRFATAECERFDITHGATEKFLDVFQRGGRYSALLYTYMEKLFVLQQMSVAVGDALLESQFLSWAGIRTPLIWPDIRVDPPGDDTLLLRMHQDFGSTRCHRAWRLWVPLRDVDEFYGTIRVVPGSHLQGYLPHDDNDSLHPFVDTSKGSFQDSVSIELEAGSAVLMNPMVLHESVPNCSQRCRFTLLLQVQDLDSLYNPDDPEDPIQPMVAQTQRRARARSWQAATESRTSCGLTLDEYTLQNGSGDQRTFRFQRLTPDDIDELLDVHNAVQATIEEGYLYHRDRDFFSRLLQDRGEVIVASSDGQIVAYSCQRLLREQELGDYFSDSLLERTFGGVALGCGSAVLPDHRGYGLLNLLIGWRRNRARALGASHLTGLTSIGNLPTLKVLLDNNIPVQCLHEDEYGDNFLLMAAVNATPVITGSARLSVDLPDVNGHRHALAHGLCGCRIEYKQDTPILIYRQMIQI